MEQPPTIPQYRPPGTPPDGSPTPVIPQRKFEGLNSVLSTIGVFIAAPLIAVAITSFIFQSYEVDGPSMKDTLQDRDRLIVLKLPRTWSNITKHDYIPPRGTIVVFAKNGMYEEAAGKEKQLIKRVIGLPGERVVVADGRVTVYNSDHLEGFNPDISGDYPRIVTDSPGQIDITVGKGEVFVMGDNRHDSFDSRNFGTITAKEIVGKLAMRVMPISEAKTY